MSKAFYKSLLLLFPLLFGCQLVQEPFDIVIAHAKVMDPESGLNAVMNVGINGNKIVAIQEKNLNGKTVIDGTGKVLAPGFIDLHAHGQTNVENSFQAYDGVTTALELEVGEDSISTWLKNRKNRALLNYGASASYLALRNQLMNPSQGKNKTVEDEVSNALVEIPFPESKFNALEKGLIAAINDGAIGIGIPVGYIPAASVEEIAAVYQMAGKWGVPVFSHIREGGAIAFQQAIADAILNKTQLHICHINSMARKDINFSLDLVRKAQFLNFPITTELYPYTAGNTEISSAIFNTGWQERLGCSYQDLQWVETGERLTAASFEKYRKQGGSVIVHMLEEAWVDEAIADTITMIASDGGSFSPLGHPRGSGTFSKILRKYVRENGSITLMEALKKMTLMPARVLEETVPEMAKRGRIQEGCFADLVLFDPDKIQDHATYSKGFVKSSGMEFVWVDGRSIIENNVLVPDRFPGVAIQSNTP